MHDTAPIITVRDAQPEDAAAIQRIYAHYVLHSTATYEEIVPDAVEIARRRLAVLDSGAPYMVAELDGTVQGYAYASQFRPRAAYRYTLEHSIYVDPTATGHGIGSLLLTELIERCTALGYRQMIAVIGSTDNAASIKLHQRLGFSIAGQLQAAGFKFNAWVDTVFMQRPLGESDSTLPE